MDADLVYMQLEKPLKILTLDGGGLQAISTLFILNELLETIAKQNGSPYKKPRPCDAFDTITGIGAGGWLALLLGCFQMDITACLSEWYEIMRCISPKSKSKELRLRLLQHCYFENDKLVKHIEHLTEVYRIGERLFEFDSKGARTRHVFVAALDADSERYKIFRTYDAAKSAKLPLKLLGGPGHPENFRISHAFGVTGAAKYFTPPWKEHMEHTGRMRFTDHKFPERHNITEITLDEMWAIYGTDVPLSVIVNIGPGLPNASDIKQIARRFSWGLNPARYHIGNHKRRQRLPAARQDLERLNEKTSLPAQQIDEVGQGAINTSIQIQEPEGNQDLFSKVIPGGKHERSMNRKNTFGSIKERKFSIKLKRSEHEIEKDIKAKLSSVNPGSEKLYFRLALPEATHGTTLNDSWASTAVIADTEDYLEQPNVKEVVLDAARKASEIASTA